MIAFTSMLKVFTLFVLLLPAQAQTKAWAWDDGTVPTKSLPWRAEREK